MPRDLPSATEHRLAVDIQKRCERYKMFTDPPTAMSHLDSRHLEVGLTPYHSVWTEDVTQGSSSCGYVCGVPMGREEKWNSLSVKERERT